jgi:hypothetical protein
VGKLRALQARRGQIVRELDRINREIEEAQRRLVNSTASTGRSRRRSADWSTEITLLPLWLGKLTGRPREAPPGGASASLTDFRRPQRSLVSPSILPVQPSRIVLAKNNLPPLPSP